MKQPIISMIAAVGQNNELGANNDMLWRMPNDFKFFKRTTMGHPMIMGRKTLESLGGPLPGRTHLVVTRNRDFSAEGVLVFHSFEEALNQAAELDPDEVFIIGGGEIYKQGLPFAEKIYLTRIEGKFPKADTYFPKLDSEEWKEIERKAHKADERHKYDYAFTTLIRQRPS